MQQLTVLGFTQLYIDDCPILVLSEYRNFTMSVKQKTLTKQTPMHNGNGEVNK